jgi:hypothetical protein
MEQSTFIMQSLPPVEINGSKSHLLTLSLLIDALMALGEEEHLGDWNPFLEITLMNGETLSTQSGFPEIAFCDTKQKLIKPKAHSSYALDKIDKVGFVLESDDDEDDITWMDIHKISSIVVSR